MLLLARTRAKPQAQANERHLGVHFDADGQGRGLADPADQHPDEPYHTERYSSIMCNSGRELRRGGQGLRYILSGMNAERISSAAELSAKPKVSSKRTDYARRAYSIARSGKNQGVQFPSQGLCAMRAAELMVHKAQSLFEAVTNAAPKAKWQSCSRHDE